LLLPGGLLPNSCVLDAAPVKEEGAKAKKGTTSRQTKNNKKKKSNNKKNKPHPLSSFYKSKEASGYQSSKRIQLLCQLKIILLASQTPVCQSARNSELYCDKEWFLS
jgi:hypothetical protein